MIASVRTVAEFREIISTLDLQHDDTQDVIFRIEAVFTSLPGPSGSAFLLFSALRCNGVRRGRSGRGGISEKQITAGGLKPFPGEEFGKPAGGLRRWSWWFSLAHGVCCRSGCKDVNGYKEVVLVLVIVIGGRPIILEVRSTRDRTDRTDTLSLWGI